ncbi:hypothetical protein C1886_22005 [Pseudomonas sp. FW300-N1A1]|uniref:hypothetical protein n=1 Tax=Pseudomonas sp. FW300-N1A1 TaxID=2075555 RepID=UPI000CD3052F|nr:hypothetical protein [Pseudomonas sp. FW300-N1A1]POA17423.1 hypothetical protein C1886_22005 [Pseudomonas sp. FW300-N1A1]
MDFEIVSEISSESVGPIIAALNESDAGRTVRIILKHNNGGQIAAAFALILAIQATAARVEILMDRHIMSAAAFIWVWFAIRNQDNVVSFRPVEPAVLMYHRPRHICLDSAHHYLFRDDLEEGHPLREQLAVGVTVFDTLFDELIQALGYSQEMEFLEHDGAQYRHNLSHMRAAYYQNRDCILTF